jgi:hypothetical protein
LKREKGNTARLFRTTVIKTVQKSKEIDILFDITIGLIVEVEKLTSLPEKVRWKTVVSTEPLLGSYKDQAVHLLKVYCFGILIIIIN